MPYLTKQDKEILADHLILTVRLGYGKTRRQVMDLVERYINDKPGNENKVKISNGWWEKRNPSLCLRSGDSTAEVRMNAVNSENLNEYFQEVFQ